jgi:hypothetical protein
MLGRKHVNVRFCCEYNLVSICNLKTDLALERFQHGNRNYNGNRMRELNDGLSGSF